MEYGSKMNEETRKKLEEIIALADKGVHGDDLADLLRKLLATTPIFVDLAHLSKQAPS